MRRGPESGAPESAFARAALLVAASLIWFGTSGAADLTGDEHVMAGTATVAGPAATVPQRVFDAATWPRPVCASPPPPAAGIEVRPGESLQGVLQALPAGAEVRLGAGIHRGPLRITRRVTVWGPPEAVVLSSGIGTTVEILADSVSLLGFTVEGSGRRFDTTDAAIRVGADDVRIEGLHVRDALFGVTVEDARRVSVRGNVITGTGERDLGLRGDAIRFWEVRDSEIVGNLVTDSRDIVVWYSPGNRVCGNFVESGRYGTHFMYSHRNTAEGNTYLGNLVGIFVMYSDTVEVRANRMAFADPAGGMGLGVKESGELLVVDNILLGNQDGIYLDASPLQRGHRNLFERNAILFCETGVAFHRSGANSRFAGNEFQGCGSPARIDGGGDAMLTAWFGNRFDDYQGYDLDRDGVGDVPYELHRLSDQITSAREDLKFFRGTPALALLDLVGRIVPLLAPRILLRDPSPRTGAAAAPLAAKEAPGAH